jgi:molecular chaperone GrpE (heat shock protein)
MYDELFPIDESPQPLLDPESGDILGKCYNWIPDAGEREKLIRRNRRLKYERIGDGVERILTRLIALADAMERILQMGENDPDIRQNEVLQNWLRMVEGVYRRLRNIMEREGMAAVDSLGKPLDLDLHEVVEVRGEGKQGSEVVVEERAKAYVYDNRVIRDAKVIVERVSDSDHSSGALPHKGTKEE